MNPEDTDQFRTFEDRLERLAKVRKKELDDLKKTEAAQTDPSDIPTDGTSEEQQL